MGGQASGRNGGICMASLTHGFSQGEELFPSENAHLTELGDENLAAIERAVRELTVDCGWELTGEMEIATAPWQVDGLRELRDQSEAAGLPGTWLDGDELRANPLAHVPGRLLAPRRRHRQPRASRVGARARLRGAGRAHLRGHARHGAGALRRRRGTARAVGRRARGAHRPRHQRVPSAAAPSPLPRGAGVQLRAHDRAADACPARRDRVVAPAGPGGRRLHVPLLPAHRGPAHPLGRLGRDVLPRTPHPQGVRGPPGPFRQARRPLLPRRSRSSRGWASPTAGPA